MASFKADRANLQQASTNPGSFDGRQTYPKLRCDQPSRNQYVGMLGAHPEVEANRQRKRLAAICWLSRNRKISRGI
jgi:hypothetical protein